MFKGTSSKMGNITWKSVFVPSTGYLYLLFCTGATTFDYTLIGIGVVAAIGAGIPFPLLGILFGQLVDDLSSQACSSSQQTSGTMSDSVVQKVLYIIYITIANFFLIYLYSFSFSLFSERLVRRLRTTYITSLLRQSPAYFDVLPSGSVRHNLDTSLPSIQTGTSEKVGLCISSISYFVAAYVVAFMKSPRLAGVLFAIVPAFIIMATIGSHYGGKYAKQMSGHVSKATGVANAGLSNMIVVKAFGASTKLERVFEEHVGRARAEGIKKSIASSVQMGLLYFIAYSANALAFWFGSREIAESVNINGAEGASVGNVYTVIFILVDASFIISQVAPFLQLFATATAAYSELAPTLESSSSIDGVQSETGIKLESVKGDIEFKNVSFSYASRPDVRVLKDFNLLIPARQHTAIVGLSGSGKSTLAALIDRLYDPQTGSVLLDGHDLRVLNPKSMRRFIGCVEQNGKLFDRSILENIAHGLINSPKPEHADLQVTLLDSSLSSLAKRLQNGDKLEAVLSDADISTRKIWDLVSDAAQTANASAFIATLSHGLATSAGAAGSQLSGGQKQRIVLARAIIRQPEILLLDEATASLDSTSEHLIQAALRGFIGGRTTVTIAHRLSTVKEADNIVVMRDGQIVEQGTYMNLLEANGALAEMIRLQDVGSDYSGQSGSSTPRLAPGPRAASIDTTVVNEFTPYGFAAEEKFLDVDGRDVGKPEGVAQVKEVRPASNKTSGKIRNLISVFGMSRPWLGFVLLGLAASTIVGGSHSGEAVIFGYTIGGLAPCKGADGILSSGRLFGLLFFILAIVEFFANVISTSSFGRVAESLLYRVRMQILGSLFHQDIEWHESEGRTPSSLVSYISSDANSLSGLTGTVFGVIFAILMNMISGIIVAHVFAWKIAVVLLAVVPVLLAAGFLRLRVLAQFHERHQKAFANSVGIATEAMGSIKTIATFSLEKEILETYERSLEKPYKETIRSIAFGNMWLAVAFSISNLVYALAYWWGSKQISEGKYNQTQFFIVLPALLFSAQSCGQMFSLAPDVSKASVAAGRVLELIRAGPSTQVYNQRKIRDVESCSSSATEIDEKLPVGEAGLGIKFCDVRFSYPSRPGISILKGLSLNIAPNTFVALVGPSGAGKSTIISLLERFYVPSSGDILLNNMSLARLSGSGFRDDIALVPQASALFEGTVRFNVCLGARTSGIEPTEEDVVEACKAANIHNTIVAMKDGYDTMCGPNGDQFSGGQMQRLAIARALIRKPRLLLLDESTSALDAESEALMQESLDKCCRGNGLTVVAVAHRLRTIKNADRIFLIEEGRCADEGDHAQLLERSDTYRKNVALQTLE